MCCSRVCTRNQEERQVAAFLRLSAINLDKVMTGWENERISKRAVLTRLNEEQAADYNRRQNTEMLSGAML